MGRFARSVIPNCFTYVWVPVFCAPTQWHRSNLLYLCLRRLIRSLHNGLCVISIHATFITCFTGEDKSLSGVGSASKISWGLKTEAEYKGNRDFISMELFYWVLTANMTIQNTRIYRKIHVWAQSAAPQFCYLLGKLHQVRSDYFKF